MHQFLVGQEKEIISEIKAWSKYALEKKSKEFNGLPPCPYAKKAWKDDKVSVIFKHEPDNYQDICQVISTWDDAVDLVIVVDTAFQPNPDDFHEYLDGLNEAIANGFFINRDAWLMGFHPFQDPNELIDDGSFDPIVDTEYAMIFIQRLSKVQEAAQKIAKLGYYDNYFGSYDAAEIYEKRNELHRRLSNGDES